MTESLLCLRTRGFHFGPAVVSHAASQPPEWCFRPHKVQPPRSLWNRTPLRKRPHSTHFFNNFFKLPLLIVTLGGFLHYFLFSQGSMSLYFFITEKLESLTAKQNSTVEWSITNLKQNSTAVWVHYKLETKTAPWYGSTINLKQKLHHGMGPL